MSNMKYYTNIVPTHIYSKLLEKGMPELLETYAEVFDWLMRKGVWISIFPDKGSISIDFDLDKESINADDMWRYSCDGKQNFVSTEAKGWIECADDAIRTANEQLI